MLEKFKSRKFLMALLSVILGVLGMFGVADNTIETVSSIALILIPVIVYILQEGQIDKKAVDVSLDALLDILKILGIGKEVEPTDVVNVGGEVEHDNGQETDRVV